MNAPFEIVSIKIPKMIIRLQLTIRRGEPGEEGNVGNDEQDASGSIFVKSRLGAGGKDSDKSTDSEAFRLPNTVRSR